MSISVQFIYDTPQREIASLLRDMYNRCSASYLVAGFMTVEGIDTIMQPIQSNSSKLSTLVVGAGTYRAFETFDQLLASEVRVLSAGVRESS